MSEYSAHVVLDNREAISVAETSLKDSSFDRIIIKDCHLGTKEAATIIHIFRNNEFKEVLFERCTGHLSAILSVVLACTTLESLSILIGSSNSTAFEPLAHSLGVGLLTNSKLKKLRLGTSNCSFFTLTSCAARSLEEGLCGNKTLSSLHIDNCRFADRCALRIFAEAFRGSLRDVRIASCYEPNGQILEDPSIAHLIHALKNSTELEQLDISHNKCLDMGMIALASLLDKTRLRKLNVSSQEMDRNEFMNTFHLVGALGRTSSLESLQLQSNNLSSDYDMANIAAVLSHNTSIKHIDLTYNNIRSSAMTILASRIPSMKVLEHLLIDGNGGFDDETSMSLVKAMKENMVIRNFSCDPNLADFKTIEYYADLNWSGRRFIAAANTKTNKTHETIAPISMALWPRILSRIGRMSTDHERQANAIYFILQRGSAIIPI